MPLIRKAVLWQLALWVCSTLLLFGAAGTLTWWAGWTFLVLFFGVVAVLATWSYRHAPDLLAERMTLWHADQPVWDRWFLAVFYLLSLIWLPLMALDAVRWHWSSLPIMLRAVGLVLFTCALLGIAMTIRANRFLSPVVRFQKERGHQVIAIGPYQVVRHPLYLAATLFYIGVPLLLGSWSGVYSAAVFVGLLAYRAVREERWLYSELAGYDEYMQQVRWRLLPGFW